MSTPFIVGIAGTNRERSLSRAAMREALHIAAERGADVEALDLRALNLPMYSPDRALDDYDAAHRANLGHFLDACRAATALVWCSPAYHGTVSGIFKNAIDFFELMSESEPPYLSGKCVGLIAINDSKTFGAMSNSVHELRAYLAPTHVVLKKDDFDADLKFSSPRATRQVGRLVGELIRFRQH